MSPPPSPSPLEGEGWVGGNFKRFKMNKIKTRKELTDKEIISLLKKHKDLLKKYKVKRIGLFGSYVRGEQKRYSDIDFLVEFKEANFDNFMGLIFGLETIFGKKVELITNGSLSPYIEPYVEKEVKWYEA
jgi:predicted nucleotidyltransferase